MNHLDPKALRAQAKELLELAKTIEMSQDPQKYLERQMKSKINGMKHKTHKARTDFVKKMIGL